MANPNISASLTAEQKTTVRNNLNAVKSTLSFTVNLTPKERKTLFKMGAKSVGFVELALRVAKENPGILPVGFNIAEFEKDVKLSLDLVEINTILAPLAEAVDDTNLAVGSEAMAQSNRIYELVKSAAKHDANLKELKNQLAERYKRAKIKNDSTQ